MTDSPYSSTGYGQVMYSLLKRWQKYKGFEFKHIGWQSWERQHKRAEGYYVLPRAKQDYGYDVLLTHILKEKPDILLTLCDVGWQSGYINIVREAKKKGWQGTWMAYIPIDSNVIAWTWDNIFANIDVIIAMSKWGYKQIKSVGTANELYMIPHGVDLNIYKPLDKQKLKKKGGLDNFFVIGACGRNQIRKMWVYLLKGFARFAQDKNDVLLLLHTDEDPPAGMNAGWSIPYLTHLYNITNKVKLTVPKLSVVDRLYISHEKINKIYNLFDVMCFPTGGEGFGLPILEAQASGVPVMTTAFTTGFELVEGHGWLIPILKDKYKRDVMWTGLNGVEFAIPDDLMITKYLQEAYEDWKYNNSTKLNSLGAESREFAKKYDWDIIAKKWIDLFKKYANNK